MPENLQETWTAGASNELAFWSHWMETKGDRWPEEFEQRLDPFTPLQDYIIRHLDPAEKRVRILDVGAGPMSIVGKVWPGHDVEIVAVDALADEYRKLLDQHGIRPPVYTEACHSERVADRFPADHFDLVHVRNALDHGYDPMRALRQMLTVVKPGCCVVTVHFTNEGEKAKYAGFHQWNFEVEGKDMVVWNRRARHSVRRELRDVAEIVSISPAGDEWCSLTLRKLARRRRRLLGLHRQDLGGG